MTHTFPSTEFPAAYANASNYEDDVIKTLVVCECSCCICSRWSLDGPCEGQIVHFSTKGGVPDLRPLLCTGNDGGIDAPGATLPTNTENGGVSAAGVSAELVCEPCKNQQRYVPTKL